METTKLTESQDRRAAKVAGFAAAIALTGTLAVKAKNAVSKRRQELKARRHADLTVDA